MDSENCGVEQAREEEVPSSDHDGSVKNGQEIDAEEIVESCSEVAEPLSEEYETVIDCMAEPDSSLAEVTESYDVEEDQHPVETPSSGYYSESLCVHCTEEEEAETLTRFAQLKNEIITEKRSYDHLVHSLNKKQLEITGVQHKYQNEVIGLKFSVSKILKEIDDIENNPVNLPVKPLSHTKPVRGPPLPPQTEMFTKAWENGQVGQSYSQFSQRQWQSQSRYVRK